MKKIISLVMILVFSTAVEVANADFTFGTPVNLGQPVNSSANEWGSSISADGLNLYFTSKRPGGSGDEDLWVTTRDTKEDEWGTPVNLGPIVNSSSGDGMPRISTDGLALYFMSGRPGGSGNVDLWVTTRETTHDEWGPPVNLGPTVNSAFFDGGPDISADGLDLYFTSNRPSGSGDFDLWVTTRATTSDPWGEPANLGPIVNSSVGEYYSSLSADGLVLFFQDDNLDICLTQRKTTADPFGPAVKLPTQINTSRVEGAPSLSYDGSTLYFSSNNSGGYGKNDTWQVSIEPVVDLNSDGIVDAADMCIIVDYWGTDEPLCDIGPMAWGDGIVDVQDLIVLAEHLFEGFGDTVIERRISASSDDAEEALNAGYTNWNYSSDLEIVHDRIDNGGSQLVGMTFQDISIAPGEVISDAYIEFVCDERINGTADAYFLIWGHLTPNSEGFIAPYVISSRPKTEAKVPWEPDPWDAGGQKIQTVNIASIIQELIDQEGWVAGNAVEIIIGEDPSKPAFTGVRCAESYDGSPPNAPLLHIEIAVP
ncbi:MAG: hypothetical protein ACYTBX_09675 [Planctomycetota bacterium]|jgi:hypothetical protein